MTKLYYTSVSDSLVEILRKCMVAPCLKDFVLVGGTALSLQRGHRVSIDIDLFTDIDYGTMPLGKIADFFKNEFYHVEGLESFSSSALGYHIRVASREGVAIKVDLFYTEHFIFPIKEIDGIRLADEREIAAMKMLAIGGEIKRQKDYWDIYELSQDYTLYDMIEWGLNRNPYSLDLEDLKYAFKNVLTLPESFGEVQSLKGDNWQLIQYDLLELYLSEENDINRITV